MIISEMQHKLATWAESDPNRRFDRLLHHSTVITIRGDSYRLREKRRSGLLQKAGSALDNTATAPH